VRTNGNELKNRPISELAQLLAEDGKTLIRQEIALAKAELQERVELVRLELEDRRELITRDLARDADSARDELAESGKEAASGAAMFAAAGVVGLVVLGLLAALVARLLEYAMPLAAAIAVTIALFAAVAAGLALVGRSRMKRASPLVRPRTIDRIRQDLTRLSSLGRLSAVAARPEQTIETVKEDIEWVKHPTKSGTK
jgi:hypothetical protein